MTKVIIAMFSICTLFLSQPSWGENVFVRQARGYGVSKQELNKVTAMVKDSVQKISWHKLINSEKNADYVLQPRVISMMNDKLLRIDKIVNGLVSSSSERSFSTESEVASHVTQDALREESYISRALDESEYQQAPAPLSPVVEIRAQSEDQPLIPGYITIGTGTGFALNLDSDNVMFNINAGYNYDVNPQFTAKGFADINFGSGDDTSRFLYFAAGGNFFLWETSIEKGRPYLMGDLGYASARTDDEPGKLSANSDALGLGAGAGFQFAAQELNLDANVHYTVLTSQIADATPAILAVRLALNF